MARCQFGATSADFVSDVRGNRRVGTTGTVWTAQTGGTRITDLLDAEGNATTVVTPSTDPKGMVQFQGPNDGTSVVWVDFGSGRVRIVAPDGYAFIVDEVNGSYAARPAGAQCVIWRGTTLPAGALSGDLRIDTGA